MKLWKHWSERDSGRPKMTKAFCLTLLWSLVVCARSRSIRCSCTDAVCPKADSPCPNGRVNDTCGCCLVCRKKVGEICGGRNELFGRCERNLRCAYGDVNLVSKLKVGFCEKRSADRNITSIICRKKTYIDKKIDAAGVYRCYQDACGVMNRVSTIQASCLAIGCGIERSSTSPCCLLCRQDTPTISCDSGRMQVAIPKSLMSRQLFLNSSLRDPNCRGYETKRNFVFATKIYNCGTAILSQVGGQQSYSNSVQTTADEGKTKRPFVKVSCTFERKLLAQGLYKIKQTKVSGVLTGILFAFTSKGGRLLSSKKKFLASEKRIDVSISSYVAKRFRLKLLVNSCHLSVSKWIAWGNKKEHYLIKNGCVVDKNVKKVFTRNHALWFSYQTDEAQTWLRGQIYLHCDVTLCSRRSVSTKCNITCP